MQFIIGTYPEYQNIIEGAISAQYSESTIEVIHKPHFINKKYSDVIPIEPTKDPIFPIKLFKQLEDDPMNNIIDTMSKVSPDDTFSVILTIKPIKSNSFNRRAKKRSE